MDEKKNFYYNYTRTGIIMEKTELSKFVKEKRKEYGLTQIDLSQKSGVGLRFIRDLEQGKKTLRLDKVNLVLSMFGTEVGVVAINHITH